MSPEVLERSFAAAKQFYDLPQHERMHVKVPEGSMNSHGYSWPGREKASGQNNGEYYNGPKDPEDLMALNEAFIIGADDDLQEPNLWLPESTVPGFRGQAVTLYDEMWKIAAEILRAVALGLGMDHEDDLLNLHSKNGNALSFRHYPPIDIAKANDLGIPRLAPHRDFSPSVTLLFQDECGGLEIKSPGSNEEFCPVPYIEGTLVMNIGDVLMRWSNELPPTHAGSTTDVSTTPHRYSIPFFVHPKRDTILESFPSCCSEDNAPKYEPTSYLGYVQDSMKNLYNEQAKA